MSRKTRRFVPRLEMFDERSLPSVSAAMVPNSTILQITGDAAANTVVIQDSGLVGGVTVIADGQKFQFDDRITSILVDTLAGNDRVEYDLTGPMVANRIVRVDLGKGADTFTANLSGQALNSWSNLDISAYGGGGGDTLTLNAMGVSTDQNATLNVYFSGDAGKDTINLYYSAGLLDLGMVILQKDQRH